MEPQSCFTRTFRPEYFNDPSSGNPAHTQSQIQRERTGPNYININSSHFSKFHNGSLPEPLPYFFHCSFQIPFFGFFFFLYHNILIISHFAPTIVLFFLGIWFLRKSFAGLSFTGKIYFSRFGSVSGTYNSSFFKNI